MSPLHRKIYVLLLGRKGEGREPSLFCSLDCFQLKKIFVPNGIFWSDIFWSPSPAPAFAGLAPFYSKPGLNAVFWTPEGTSLIPLFIMVASLMLFIAISIISNNLAYTFSSLLSSCSMRIEKLGILVTSLSSIARKYLTYYRSSINIVKLISE